MKTALTTVALAAVITVFGASSAKASTNYNCVGEKAKKAMQESARAVELAERIPAAYSQYAEGIRQLASAGSERGFDIWQAVQQGNAEGSHDTLLTKAREAKGAMEVVQRVAKGLKRKADDDDNDEAEDLAQAIKDAARSAERAFRQTKNELD